VEDACHLFAPVGTVFSNSPKRRADASAAASIDPCSVLFERVSLRERVYEFQMDAASSL
jgi:hypothetical protein